ncbi:MAG: crossover junction endodeoxyribonuclease RuvC [Hyphomicrobiaceae bacterium]|nr:crossover junction endodeoxyribonuclease RuvC [Hyphomicrobiaceae bacterium]
MNHTVRIIGIDPGLQRTGWGVIEATGNRVSFVAAGIVTSDAKRGLPERLVELANGLGKVLDDHSPDEAAVEETFVNDNPRATLKLGQARGIALMLPASRLLPVAEYAPNQIKKTVVGAGHAEKQQIRHMVRILLPTAKFDGDDAADALAIAICHSHHRGAASRLAELNAAEEARAPRIAAAFGRARVVRSRGG